jgi:hypothetical protein
MAHVDSAPAETDVAPVSNEGANAIDFVVVPVPN